jgi:GT2 family glycosyltransferase
MNLDPISFCINTAVNELDNLKLLFRSLKDNLRYKRHEIIVFIDSDNERTYEWLLTQKTEFKNLKILKNPLPIPYGYQRNINEMFKFASHDIVSYLQSDMVISKDYDFYLSKHIKPNMVLSSTRVEPPLHGPGPEKHTADFGLYPEQFKYDEFQKFCNENRMDKTTSYFFAPFTMYKEVWNSIGGHDTQFRRSREDSDVLNRLILAGNKIVQTWEALVYHFTCTSSRGKDWFNPQNTKAQERAQRQQQADQIELRKFFKKWGTFSHGQPVDYFYKINASINVDENNINKLEAVESYFDKVYLSSKEILNNLPNLHLHANQLLNVSENDWGQYSYMFNNHSLRNYSTDIPQGDILISFNLSNVNQNTFGNFISNLQHIIHQTEDRGIFEYEGFKIQINQKVNSIKEKIKVNNPVVKTSDLYLIS